MTQRERKDIFRVMDADTLKTGKEDIRTRRFLLPKRILWTKGHVENSQTLLEDREIQRVWASYI